MKKLLLVLAILAITTPAFCADGDITVSEERPAITKWSLDTVRLLAISETAEITFRKVDANGDPVGEEFTVSFRNVADNPETPEDETSNKFTQLITYIQNQIDGGKTLKWAITNACKIALGL